VAEVLRISALALFVVGPTVAMLALLRRRREPSPILYRMRGWRGYVPAVLLPVEWIAAPALIALRVGEINGGWLPVRLVGLAVSVAGAAVLVWASAVLGRFMMHAAVVSENHALVERGPYQFVRHPVYAGYLALLFGSGLASLNMCVLLLWPVSLLGILIQAASEEQLLQARLTQTYEHYVRRTGRLFPRIRSQTSFSSDSRS
jgi:protein-S-isoprenylcysteine O-methyltransferase Ste14